MTSKSKTLSLRTIALLPSLLLFTSIQGNSQILRQLERKAQQKLEQTIDRGIDQIGKPSSKKKPSENNSPQETPPSNPSQEVQKTSQEGTTVTTSPSTPSNQSSQDSVALFKRYNKFDFIPGDKIIAFDNYAQDEIGQPPIKWNYNGNAEVVQLAGSTEKFVAISGEYTLFHLDYIKSLPVNFTLEFDLAVDQDYKGNGIKFFFLHRDKATYRASNTFNTSSSYHPKGSFELDLSPINGNKNTGRLYYAYRYNDQTVSNSDYEFNYFTAKQNNKVRVSIWRQNQRLRIYFDEHKVIDLPRAFNSNLDYTDLVLNVTPKSPFYMGAITLAEGKPDLRSKFNESGTFSTTGILFDLNKATVKPQSYGILKEIASLLASTPDRKVKITGHTDSDGKADHNLALSLQRAQAVKNVLVQEFQLKEEQLQVEGKGSQEPVADNTTDEGKAQNRRVEFSLIP